MQHSTGDSGHFLRFPLALLTAAIPMLSGCAGGLALPRRVTSLDPLTCPAIANVHPVDLARLLVERQSSPDQNDPLAELAIPTDRGSIPAPEAVFVIRTRVPPAAFYPEDDQSIVWRMADGTWFGWHRSLNGSVGDMPPPTPDGLGMNDSETGPWEPYPDEMGKIDGEARDILERAYTDPCRQLEPSLWPMTYRLRHAEDGSRRKICEIPLDYSPVYAEVAEPNRPPRRVSSRCGPGGRTAEMINVVAYISLPTLPRRHVPRM